MNKSPVSQQLLSQLVGFPTVSRESNLDLIAFISDYLTQHGVKSELFFNPARDKASLFATIGPENRSGIALSGHTDVVPVDGQSWTTDPFVLREQAGRLYGRGTADMKGFIACVLAAVPAWTHAPLRQPVHLAFSYDEEVGCLGVRPMLAELARRPIKPKLCLIGEPTELKPVLGHKGKLAMRCCVTGSACHSAHAPSGVNAIEYAARLIHRLSDIGERLARHGRRDASFDPPHATLQTGVIHGGKALNIVPAECHFDFEVRPLPGLANDEADAVMSELQVFATQELLPRMQAVNPQTGIAFEPLSAYPGLATPPDSEAAQLLGWLCHDTHFGTVAFGTEGGLYTQAGIPAIVCGPGSMAQGHKPDEFVTTAQLAGCDAMLTRLTHYLCRESL